jgi:hypothetical protein
MNCKIKIPNAILIGSLYFAGSAGMLSSLQAFQQQAHTVDSLTKEDRTKELFKLLVRGGLSNAENQMALEFVRSGVDVNAKEPNQYQETLLHMAAGRGCSNIIEALLQNGADVNVRDANRSTPLHWALILFYWAIDQGASQKIEEAINVVDVLIKTKNIDLNAVNKNECTLLDFAIAAMITAASRKNEVALKKTFTITEQLIVRGAANLKFYLKDWFDKNDKIVQDSIGLVKYWIELNKIDPYQLLIKVPNKLEAPIINRVMREWIPEKRFDKLVELLMRSELSANEKQIVLAFIKCDVDLNAVDKNTGGKISFSKVVNNAVFKNGINFHGRLLHLAAGSLGRDIVEALLEKGADVNAHDNFRNTPLHWAFSFFCWLVEYRTSKRLKELTNIIDMLIETKGIDLNAVNEYGNTPLDFIFKAIMEAAFEKDGIAMKNIFTIIKKLILKDVSIVRLDSLLPYLNSTLEKLAWYLMHDIVLDRHTQQVIMITKPTEKQGKIFKDSINLISKWIALKKVCPKINQIDQLETKETKQLEALIMAQMSTI